MFHTSVTGEHKILLRTNTLTIFLCQAIKSIHKQFEHFIYSSVVPLERLFGLIMTSSVVE